VLRYIGLDVQQFLVLSNTWCILTHYTPAQNFLMIAASWCTTSNNRTIMLNMTDNYFNWKSIWQLFKDLKKNCRSSKASRQQSKVIRTTTNGLLTMETMEKYAADIYEDLKCPFCNTHKETLDHLAVCEHTEHLWINLEGRLADTLAYALNKKWGRK